MHCLSGEWGSVMSHAPCCRTHRDAVCTVMLHAPSHVGKLDPANAKNQVARAMTANTTEETIIFSRTLAGPSAFESLRLRRQPGTTGVLAATPVMRV